MEKNTLLAVLLSTVVIIGGLLLQARFFPAPEMPEPRAAEAVETTGEASEVTAAPMRKAVSSGQLAYEYAAGEEPVSRTIEAETDRYYITFSTDGGVVTSLKLKEHLDQGQPLEMIFRGSEDQAAFDLSFGGQDAAPVRDPFSFRKIDDYTFEFSRVFLAPPDTDGERHPFTLKKTYVFTPTDYMLELRIAVENSVNRIPAINFDGYSYTLGFGPQIGPEFTELDGRYEYRNFYSYAGKKADQIKVKNDLKTLEERVTWMALAGKYFTAVAIPDATEYEISLSSEPVEGLSQSSQIFLSRPLLNSSNSRDVFKFYLGPKQKKYLLPYNKSDENGFAMKDLNLDEVVDSSALLGWLEWLLQKFLVLLYKLIPNYGIAIIILTVFIKVVLFPFTKKSYQSTAKMSALGPKMEELKKQYSDQPEKLNKAMSELYKKEGVNPMGGCLPMLLQFPVFFAMYGLMNKYFEFRGAVFIPGWITDLAGPESVYHFTNALPLLNWTDIRLLPIIFVGSQILSSKIMQSNQTGGGANQSTMKMMMYFMPIMFFFILYNAPSGLLVYWIFSNLFTMLQQMYTNRHLKPAQAAAGGPDLRIVGKDEPAKKVLPPSAKKKGGKKKS